MTRRTREFVDTFKLIAWLTFFIAGSMYIYEHFFKTDPAIQAFKASPTQQAHSSSGTRP